MDFTPLNATPLDWTTSPERILGDIHSHARAVLPITLEELYFVSQGERLGGIFELSQGDPSAETDIAIVDVDAFYRVEGALNGVTVRHLQGSGNEGVGLFVSVYLSVLRHSVDETLLCHIARDWRPTCRRQSPLVPY